MRRYRLSPLARRDLDRIALYVAEVGGTGIAAKVVKRIRSACQLLADTPGEIGTRRPEIRSGLRSFPVVRYVVFFRYTDGEVQVVRVLDERQDIEGHLRA